MNMTVDFDRGMVVGMALACSIVQRSFDQPTIVEEVLGAAGLTTPAQLRAAGVDDYDINILSPIMKTMRERRK